MQTNRLEHDAEVREGRTPPALCPRTDIAEFEDHFAIEVELPGVAADSIDLQVDDDELLVSAARDGASRDGHAGGSAESGYLLRERRSGTYRRVFHLGPLVDRGSITGRLVDGVLRVRVPKTAGALPRRISVTA